MMREFASDPLETLHRSIVGSLCCDTFCETKIQNIVTVQVVPIASPSHLSFEQRDVIDSPTSTSFQGCAGFDMGHMNHVTIEDCVSDDFNGAIEIGPAYDSPNAIRTANLYQDPSEKQMFVRLQTIYKNSLNDLDILPK
jgi:hypothetical protein